MRPIRRPTTGTACSSLPPGSERAEAAAQFRVDFCIVFHYNGRRKHVHNQGSIVQAWLGGCVLKTPESERVSAYLGTFILTHFRTSGIGKGQVSMVLGLTVA